MANFFTNVIRWMEITKTCYKHMEDMVVDMYNALGNVDIQDIAFALTRIARKQDMANRDVRIAKLIQEKGELEIWLVEQKWTKGKQRLLGLLEDHVHNMGDVVTKALLYDEAVAKTGTITSLKLIHICVDYSAKMETILAKMRSLFSARRRLVHNSPILLDKVPDLTEFPNLPPADILQGLQRPMMLRTNPDSTRFGFPKDLGFDARSKARKTFRHQLQIRLLHF